MTTDLDLYSPLCLIVGGLLGIAYFGLLKYLLSRQPRPALNEQLEAAFLRFRSRQKLSWILVAFGMLWFLQIQIEERPPSSWNLGVLEDLFAKASVKVRNPAGK